MEKNKTKSPWLALILSLIIPGLGQVYSGLLLRGAVFLVVNIGIQWPILVGYLSPDVYVEPWWLKWGVILFQVAVSIDAFFCKVRYNKTDDIDAKDKLARIKRLTLPAVISVLLFGLSLALFIRTYFVQPFRAPTDSMAKTLELGDRFFADKRIYKVSNPQHGDVIVFKSPKNLKNILVKRLIGLGGDVVEIKNGTIFINGEIFQTVGMEGVNYLNAGKFGGVGQKIIVPAGNYYVLGDNSPVSSDSRHWGFVPATNIVGKAFKIFYPPARVRLIK
ncbi:MAG: signal peptidase I [Candidatus Omnitrophota bacterium]